MKEISFDEMVKINEDFVLKLLKANSDTPKWWANELLYKLNCMEFARVNYNMKKENKSNGTV